MGDSVMMSNTSGNYSVVSWSQGTYGVKISLIDIIYYKMKFNSFTMFLEVIWYP